jgi:hypothetical protein
MSNASITTNLSGYVPYTGATKSVNLGDKSLSAAYLTVEDTSGGDFIVSQINPDGIYHIHQIPAEKNFVIKDYDDVNTVFQTIAEFIYNTSTAERFLRLSGGLVLPASVFGAGNELEGAFEYNSDRFYGTIATGIARKEFTLSDTTLTSGRVPFATTNGRLMDSSSLVWNDTTKRLGIGTSPTARLHVVETNTAVGASYFMTLNDLKWTPSAADGTYTNVACRNVCTKDGGFNVTGTLALRGFQNQVANIGTGNVTDATGGTFYLSNIGSGTISNGYGAYFISPYSAGAGSPITTYTHVYLAAVAGAGITNAYALYQAGSSDLNVFMGSVGVKMSPTYTLDVTGNFRCSTGLGCNGKTPQTAYASGGAVTTSAGAFGFNSDAERANLTTLVSNIRAALVANGIMS